MSDAESGASNAEPSFLQKLFADFDWGRFVGAVAIGAGAGGAYSVFDQTILHRKKPGDKLPLSTERLEKLAPDILAALDRLYQYRNTVPTIQHKREFRRCTEEVMRQSEYIAALYWKGMDPEMHVTPDMSIIALFNQMKEHVRVVFEGLRFMLALVQKPGAEDDVELTDAFNRLYECYNNRLFNMEKTFR